MARGRFQTLQQLVPRALDGLAEVAAKDGALAPGWAQCVGAPIARVSRPISLAAGTLHVEVDGEAWAKELEARKAELIARLGRAFGGRVKKLRLTLSKG